MTITTYFKAAAKTVAAAAVGWLASKGVEVDGQALEVVVTGLFVGFGSIVVNGVLVLLQRSKLGAFVERLLPDYGTK